jgi:chromosomal replication initiator protein
LNPRYQFETFVCGPSNQFAFAASKAVADKPGQSYNPLFLFGRVGLGKTHLVTAIGQHVLRANPATRVIYTSSEQFTNEVVNAVLGNKLEQLHQKYRDKCEVLLIDDIQLIAGKERTQHEFFHIFNTLYDSQRQIVVTSDKLPHEIPDIEERLRNRFQFGLIADIQAPEIETRVAILRQKAIEEGVNVPDDVAFFLAENIRSNVRELEGGLVRVLAHASLTGAPITVEHARRVLSDIIDSRPAQLSVESIQKSVADYFRVRVADLKSKRRHKTLVRPRQVAMYLARKHVQASYPDLGTRFGDKDHTTVMSACRKIESLLAADSSLRTQVTDIERRLDVLHK